nr:helix-turn-helix transcriptional regulator [Nocardia panacis]
MHEHCQLARRLGDILRDHRENTRWTLQRAARKSHISASAIQRIEAGKVTPRWERVRAICDAYGVDPTETERLVDLAIKIREQPDVRFGGVHGTDFDIYPYMEAAAEQVTAYQHLVPDLLQTPTYAQALHGPRPGIEVRLARQSLLASRPDPLRLAVLLDESMLHRVVGSDRTMAEQLHKLATDSERPNITLRILPFTATPAEPPPSPFAVIDIPFEPPAAYLHGGACGDLVLDTTEHVTRFRTAIETLEQTALDEESTRDILRRTATDYEHGDRPRPGHLHLVEPPPSTDSQHPPIEQISR